jgi:hypothetical protein
MEDREQLGAEALGAQTASLTEGDELVNTPQSLLDVLQQRRKEQQEHTEVYISISGYDKPPIILAACYRLLEGKEIDEIGRKVTSGTKDRWQRQVFAAIDTFIAACTGFYYDDEPDKTLSEEERWKPLTLNGVHVNGYTTELARALQFEASTAREVAFGLFAGNDVAIMQHNVRLSLWMGDTSRDVNQDFLGEV